MLALDEDNRALAVEATVRLGEYFHHLGQLAAAEHALVTGLDGARHIGPTNVWRLRLLTLSENFIKRGNLPEADRIVKGSPAGGAGCRQGDAGPGDGPIGRDAVELGHGSRGRAVG